MSVSATTKTENGKDLVLANHAYFTQKDWQACMGQPHIDDDIAQANLFDSEERPNLAKFRQNMVEVGLCGTAANFKSIPSCVKTQEALRSPPYLMTRLILTKQSDEECDGLVIQAPNGLIHLEKTDGLWKLMSMYGREVFHWFSKDQHPLVIAELEKFVVISKITEEISKVETAARETLTLVNLPAGVSNIALGYVGYPTPLERAIAEKERESTKSTLSGAGDQNAAAERRL